MTPEKAGQNHPPARSQAAAYFLRNSRVEGGWNNTPDQAPGLKFARKRKLAS
jgi:hypothetical protein